MEFSYEAVSTFWTSSVSLPSSYSRPDMWFAEEGVRAGEKCLFLLLTGPSEDKTRLPDVCDLEFLPVV